MPRRQFSADDRVQVQEPLAAVPSLRPTSRPIGVGSGARPAPRAQDNGIFALAESLSDWQPVLRQMLSDKVSQEQEAAILQGELKAAELNAQQRMTALNSQLKTFVDEGVVSKAQLPFFQTGFSRRTGRDIALTELQSTLDAGYKATTTVEGRVNPDEFLNKTLADFRSRLPQGDIYAAKGFDEVAAQITQNFRQRSNAEYQSNYEKAAETKIANEGIDLLQRFVLSDDVDEKPEALKAFGAYFTGLKESELPKSEVAPFVVKNAVAPMVEDLVARGDFDGADELVSTMEDFDVTGQGGLLGNIASTKGALAQMKLTIAERRRRADDPTESARKKINAAYFQGEADAKVALVDLGDTPLSAATKRELVTKYREKNADNKWAVSTFSDYLDRTYREGVTQDDPAVFADIARMAESTDPEKLNRALEALSTADGAGTISPKSRLTLEDRINKSRALFGLVDDADERRVESTIYRSERDAYDANKILPVFASAETYLSDTMTPATRLAHRQASMQFYRDNLREKLRSGAFPSVEEAQAALPQLRSQALTETIAYADKLTATFLPKEDAGAKAAPPQGGSKPGEKKAGAASQSDPLNGVVTATAEAKFNDPDRNRAAFLSFFTEPFQEAAPWPSSGRLQGLTPTLKDTGKFFPAAERMSEADAAAYQEKIRPALVYKAVKTDYLNLVKYRERGSDAGDPNYIKRLRELATNLKTYGGAEYLTPEQLTNLGLNPAAFPTAGTKAGLLK